MSGNEDSVGVVAHACMSPFCNGDVEHSHGVVYVCQDCSSVAIEGEVIGRAQ